MSSNLGPLQISLKLMIFDVLSFFVFLAVILSAFAIGMSSLYAGYPGSVSFDHAQLENISQPEAFSR